MERIFEFHDEETMNHALVRRDHQFRFLKIYFCGTIETAYAKASLCLRVNGADSGYQGGSNGSMHTSDEVKLGHSYGLGRCTRGYDSFFSGEASFSLNGSIVTFESRSSFSESDANIFGYAGHGAIRLQNCQNGIESFSVFFEQGNSKISGSIWGMI